MANSSLPASTARLSSSIAGQVARLREDARGVVDHELPGLAGLQRLRGPVHELGSERRLEHVDAFQQRGRRQTESLRRPRDFPGGEQSDEVEEAGGPEELGSLHASEQAIR
jgi:hypothetical protein